MVCHSSCAEAEMVRHVCLPEAMEAMETMEVGAIGWTCMVISSIDSQNMRPAVCHVQWSCGRPSPSSDINQNHFHWRERQ